MLPRTLEPEVMDTTEEAADYDAMDHSEVNRRFVDDLLDAWSGTSIDQDVRVLDVGTGTALIPIELAGRDIDADIIGVDLAEEMLAVGRQNVQKAACTNITLERVDAKGLPYSDESFDIVMSNSIVHHIPDPTSTFAEMKRVLKSDGLLFVRDLLRPDSAETVEQLVSTYAGEETPHQQQLFRQSLHAALTLDELRAILATVRLPVDGLNQTSDRHWTFIRKA